jgi:hypothetical protein
MHWTEIPAGELNAALLRFYKALGKDAGRVVDFLNKAEGYEERLAEFATTFALPLSDEYKMARQIMGSEMFGIEELITHLKTYPRKSHIETLQRIPFTRGTLEACQLSHYLVARIVSLEEARWTLISQTPRRDSKGMAWDEQQKLPGEHEAIASSSELIDAFVAYKYQNGERLFFPKNIDWEMIRSSSRADNMERQITFSWSSSEQHHMQADVYEGGAHPRVSIVTTIKPLR